MFNFHLKTWGVLGMLFMEEAQSQIPQTISQFPLCFRRLWNLIFSIHLNLCLMLCLSAKSLFWKCLFDECTGIIDQ